MFYKEVAVKGNTNVGESRNFFLADLMMPLVLGLDVRTCANARFFVEGRQPSVS